MWTLRGYRVRAEWRRSVIYRRTMLHTHKWYTSIRIFARARMPKGGIAFLHVNEIKVPAVWIPAGQIAIDDLDELESLNLLQGILECLETAQFLCPEDTGCQDGLVG